ncbi:DeoR/GlpR family DNA-binding transcription regulator [Spiroplasma endosymbiont of Virgichneumon dumeticola]|uniref:DeoR/GlpR family DNA-binding transcription regulator n=1 Tax=Spiroplasma endosymbiont of Virgichneumon dumeticola TaxID=3139323 RepID=UPI0035C8D69A
MHKLERKKLIIELLENNGFIKISDLYKNKKLKNISPMTINRDLNAMKKEGILETVWGGIQIPGYNFWTTQETSREEKTQISIIEKNKIAKIAGEKIIENDVIFIGTGTTLEEIVNFLNGKNVTVVTNSHFIALNCYKYSNITLILIGGRLRKKSGAYVGELANKNIKTLHFNHCFIGANGIDYNGIYNSNLEEGTINEIVLNNSKNRYILVTNDKFNKTDFVQFYSIKNIHCVITDKEIETEKFLSHNSNLKFIIT